jgi:AcrR family transcriptional regulator
VSAGTDGAADSHRSELSRERILSAAAEIAAEVGYEGTTISKVTQRSGLPVSSVYWFFKDKDDLLAEVVRHSYERWLAAQPIWARSQGDVPFTEALTAVLQRSVRSLAAAPDFLRIGQMLTLQNRPTESAARSLFLQIREGVEQTITDWFGEGLPADVVSRRPELPRDLARVVMAANDGLFLAQQIDDFWDPDEFAVFLVDVVTAAVAQH